LNEIQQISAKHIAETLMYYVLRVVVELCLLGYFKPYGTMER